MRIFSNKCNKYCSSRHCMHASPGTTFDHHRHRHRCCHHYTVLYSYLKQFSLNKFFICIQKRTKHFAHRSQTTERHAYIDWIRWNFSLKLYDCVYLKEYPCVFLCNSHLNLYIHSHIHTCRCERSTLDSARVDGFCHVRQLHARKRNTKITYKN